MFLFTHDCTACDRQQLIFPSMVSAVTHTDAGTEVAFTCWCGAEQSVVRGGGAPRPERTLVAA
jgi:hypothetical protein